MLEYQKALQEQSRDFEAFLKNEDDAHARMLESIYSKLVQVITVGLGILLAIFTFFNFTTHRRLKHDIKESIASKAEVQLKKAQNDLDLILSAAGESFKKTFGERLDQQVMELRQFFEVRVRTESEILSIITEAYVALDDFVANNGGETPAFDQVLLGRLRKQF